MFALLRVVLHVCKLCDRFADEVHSIFEFATVGIHSRSRCPCWASLVIVDEVHARDEYIDFALYTTLDRSLGVHGLRENLDDV